MPRFSLMFLATMLLAGCPSKPYEETGLEDGDGDGVAFREDCNDEDPAIYPDAPEICDGIDNDCDIQVDEDATDAGTFYQDADGDSHGDAKVPIVSCGGDGLATTSDDCDDLYADIYPGAPDTWYDGIDQNCDGVNDYDADADGFDASLYGGDDCDDTDPLIFPGATEAWYDGIDQDCDGANDYDADADGYDLDADCDDLDAAVQPAAPEIQDGIDNDCSGLADDTWAVSPDDAAGSWYGDVAGNGLGIGLRFAGDLDADGVQEVLLGGAFTLRVMDGPIMSRVPASEASNTLRSESDYIGSAFDIGDFSGDGLPDVLVGRTDGVWLVNGPVNHDVILETEADAWLQGPGGSGAGWSVATMGDVDGDEIDDLAIGAPFGEAGTVWLVSGVKAADASLEDVAVTLTGVDKGEQAGIAIADAGDIDGDGWHDLMVGAPLASGGLGKVYLDLGPIVADMSLSDAEVSITGVAKSDSVGTTLAGAGDLDGDGYNDVAIGEPGNSTMGSKCGAIFLLRGPFAGDLMLDSAESAWFGAENDHAGQSVSAAGDVDGDGFDDVLAGSSQAGGSGSTWLIRGITEGTVSLSDASRRFIGDTVHAGMGYAVTGDSDLDGDGIPDLMMGAPMDLEAGVVGGRVFFFSGFSLF